MNRYAFTNVFEAIKRPPDQEALKAKARFEKWKAMPKEIKVCIDCGNDFKTAVGRNRCTPCMNRRR